MQQLIIHYTHTNGFSGIYKGYRLYIFLLCNFYCTIGLGPHLSALNLETYNLIMHVLCPLLQLRNFVFIL